MDRHLLESLQCPACRGRLAARDTSLVCESCGKPYSIVNGAVVFEQATEETAGADIGDPLIFKLKTYFKRYQGLYYVLVRIAGALFVGEKTGLKAFGSMPAGSVVLNLGSGPKVLSESIVNVDAFPFRGVTICADALRLPFRDNSVDAVMCECVLEHVTDPNAVVREIERVLKIGGLVYVSIPFMDAYHSAPDDYYRWTTSGLRQMMKAFDERELRIAFGPTSTMISGLANWLGILLSFGSKTLYQLLTLGFMILLSPLKLLDYLLRYYPYAANASVGYYFIGAKKLR